MVNSKVQRKTVDGPDRETGESGKGGRKKW